MIAEEHTANVVIIGGGIQGLFCALSLADSGVEEVLILDALPTLGGASSMRSAAMLTRLTNQRLLSEMAIDSINRFRRLESRLAAMGHRNAFHWIGFCLCAIENDRKDQLNQHVVELQELGEELTRASGAEINEASGGLLRLPDSALGYVYEDDGYAELSNMMEGLKKLIKSAGVRKRTGAIVEEVIVEGSEVVAVTLHDETRIQTPCLVNAAGILAGDIAEMVHSPLRIIPSLKNLVTVEGVRLAGPIVEIMDDGYYFRHLSKPSQPGVMIGVGFGDDVEVQDARKDLEPNLSDKALDQCREYLARYTTIPDEAIENATGWAGYRPMPYGEAGEYDRAPDELPSIGSPDGAPSGYFESCAWGEFGITLGPVGGYEVARSVLASGRVPAKEGGGD